MNKICSCSSFVALLLWSVAISGQEPILPSENAVKKHSLVLIGDTGYKEENVSNPVLSALRVYLESLSEESSVVFLGDNICPCGMPDSTDENRALAEYIIDEQLEALNNYKGKAFFIPGNRDWNNNDLEGEEYVKRLENYVESYYADKNKVAFLPDKGCGDPTVVTISKDLIFVFVDSEWWIRNSITTNQDEDNCYIRTRRDFVNRIESIFTKYRKKRIVLFMHHPLKSTGKYSGKSSLDDHLFPLRNISNELVIPLPIVGSIFTGLKQVFSRDQYMENLGYKQLIDEIEAIAFDLELEIMYASGHDHGLQYFKEGIRHYIVSGGGSKKESVFIGFDEIFAKAKKGFATIHFYEDSETWLEFQALNKRNELKSIFKTQLYASRGKYLDKENSMQKYSTSPITDTTVVAQDGYDGNAIKKFWLGNQYRDVWTTPVNVPVLNLNDLKLTPQKVGGGKSSLALRLEDSTGLEYNLRSLDKYYHMSFGEAYKDLKLFSILQDMVAAHFTYGPLLIPSLSKAAGIYHLNPELYYVKKQEGLLGFNKVLPEQLYWLEERPDNDWSHAENFGFSSDIISTKMLKQKLRNKKNHFVDQKWVLRSRLFDMWVHDWDRHDDNWRWASFEGEESTIYRPIPRDRDMAFHKLEGVLPWIVTHFVERQLLPFGKEIKDLKYFNENAKDFDRTFLNELDWKEWVPIVEDLQEALTDEVIEEAFNNLPVEIIPLCKEEIFDKLVSRRDNLKKTAYQYYKILNKEVIVIGGNGQDIINVQIAENDEIRLTVDTKRKKKGLIRKYQRTYDPLITKSIRVYGLEDVDYFHVTGDHTTDINIHLIGGHEIDTFLNESLDKNIKLYDYSNNYESFGEMNVRESNDLKTNYYQANSFLFNREYWLLNFGYLRDDGFWMGLSQKRTVHEWPYFPYKQKHDFGISVAPAGRKFVHAFYKGNFTNLLGKGINFQTYIQAKTPANINYFGLGNNSINDQDYRYYWIRLNRYSAAISSFMNWKEDKIQFKIGSHIEGVKLDEHRDRITTHSDEFINEDFDWKAFYGLHGQFSLQHVDDNIDPHDGIKFSTNWTWNKNFDNSNYASSLSFNLTSYIPVFNSPRTTLGSNFGYEIVYGQPELYQLARLGQNAHLRGWRPDRFMGDRALYHNIDLRIHLINFYNKWMPMDIGFVGGYDYGRVWLDGEKSDEMHTSFSLGLSLKLLYRFIVLPYYAQSKEQGFIGVQTGLYF